MRKIFKILSLFLFSASAVLLFVVFAISLPPVQLWITQRAQLYLEDQYGISSHIAAIRVGFPKNIVIEGLRVNDLSNDTLLYVDKLDMNTNLTGLLWKSFGWQKLSVSGLQGNMYRLPGDSSYNFTPILDLFSPGETDAGNGSAWTFSPGDVACSNWNVRFTDASRDQAWQLQFNNFNTNIRALDIDERKIAVGKVYLAGLKSVMSGPAGTSSAKGQAPGTHSETNREEDTSAWKVSVEHIEIVDTDYTLDLPKEIALHATLRTCIMSDLSLQTSPPAIGLSKVSLDQFFCRADIRRDAVDTSAAVDMLSVNSRTDSAGTLQYGGALPAVRIDDLSITASEVHLNLDTTQRSPEHLDYNHYDVTDLAIDVSGFSQTADSLSFLLRKLQLREACGLGIRRLQGYFTLKEQHFQVPDLLLETDNSAIQARCTARFQDPGSLGTQDIDLDASVFASRIHAGDVFKVMPELQASGIIKRQGIILVDSLVGKGTLGDFHLQSAVLRVGNSSKVWASGWIGPFGASGIPDLRFQVDTAIVLAADIQGILADSTLLDPIVLPDTSGIRATADAAGDTLNISFTFRSTAGNISSNVFASMLSDSILLSGNLLCEECQPSAVVRTVPVDGLTASVDFDLQVVDSVVQVANCAIRCDTVVLQGRYLTSLHSEIQYNDHNGTIDLRIGDPQIQVGLTSQITYNEGNLRGLGKLTIDLPQADSLLDLLIPYPTVHMNMDFDMNMYGDKLAARVQSQDFTMSSARNDIDIHPLDIQYNQDSTSVALTLESAIAGLRFDSSMPFDSIPALGKSLLNNFLVPGDTTIPGSDLLMLSLTVVHPDDLANLISDDLKVLRIEQFEASYNGSNNTLRAKIDVPAIEYADFSLDSLVLSLESDSRDIHFETAFSRLAYDTISLNPLHISTTNAGGTPAVEISVQDRAGTVQQFLNISIVREDQNRFLRIDPESLVIGSKVWTVDPKNRIVISDSSLVIEDLKLGFNDEAIQLSARNKEISLSLQQVDLGNLFCSVGSPALLKNLEGTIDGDIHFYYGGGDITGTVDIDIGTMRSLDYDIGALQFRAQKEKSDTLHFWLDMHNQENTLAVAGMSDFRTSSTTLTITPGLKNLETFAFLLPDTIQILSGAISGKIDVRTDMTSTDVGGFLDIANFGVTIMPYRASFHIPQERLIFSDRSVQFNSFAIQDPEKNSLILNGTVAAGQRNDLLLDLQAATSRFKWVDAEKTKNAVVAGTLYTGLDLKLKGSIDGPAIQTEITIQEGTELIYKMPGETLEIDSDKGIVYFSEAPKTEEEFAEKEFTFIGDSLVREAGIDLSARLRISDKAQFTVITNPNGGDYTTFNLAGSALYKFNNAEGGQIIGAFEMGNKGFYELNFYGLVKKRFDFRPGSNITWSNSVMGGQLDFAAEHEVATNSIGLFSDEISQAEQSRYNQRLPYKVILEVHGTLSRPEIRFSIDLPQRYKSNYPTIASKLEALNRPTEDADAERNRQVFALLVAGTFFPSSSGGVSAGNDFATTAARNSVNAMLTQQLNNLSGQIIKGVDVDFGLNTFDEYSGGQTSSRTQMDVKVSKKLFDNRVTVEVESHIDVEGSNPNIGQSKTSGMPEWAVIYELTEDGRYRIKAFRENAFDIYDGEIQNAGIAFILLKEIELPKRKEYRYTGDE